MLIQASFWPSGRTSELACHLPSGPTQPKPRPAPSMKRQSATFWFQPASIDKGQTASLCAASIGRTSSASMLPQYLPSRTS